MTYNIIFPVYNEENRLENGISKTVEFLKNELSQRECQITIVDNASIDSTAAISKSLCQKYSNVHYIRIEEKGVGAAFRAGIRSNKCDIVGYMDIDLSTDLKHLREMVEIFENEESVGIVNGSRYSKQSRLVGRNWCRNVISYVLVFILKFFLSMGATDAICGFKFFKKDIIEKLVKESTAEDGWFYIIELLLRAERGGIHIKELPVLWVFEKHTKVKIFKVTCNYLRHIWRLFWIFRKDKKGTV